MARSIGIFLGIFLMISASLGQNLDLDGLKSQLPEGLLPTNLNNMTAPIEDIRKLAKDKCNTVSGSDAAFEAIEEAAGQLMECMTTLFNFSSLTEEIEKAQPNGELDTVFNKYCRKRHVASECFMNFSKVLEPCLTNEEISHKEVYTNISNSLLGFVCHKDGDQIALFIAEKGPECFQERKDGMIECFNKTFPKVFDRVNTISNEPMSLDNLPKFVFGPDQCHDMERLQMCVVMELEKCEESTPANLVDSAFKFIRNNTPCQNVTSINKGRANSAESSRASHVILGAALLANVAKYLL
ncbi:27 kDa hemolymph protein-like [Phlebotomus argentipes]|uniref:27 kDa hemolymph protein-like n=1 Tax=Phlebotomus argentipes TaxID=94469 RepID=UPI00289371BF|nr:27 kDa hemolymph protein-like [Phlebotomus argentipes]